MAENLPAAHGLQTDDAGATKVDEYVPAGQGVQIADDNPAYVPATQGMHVVLDECEEVPASQGVQAVAEIAPDAVPYLPLVHKVHVATEVAPVCAEYLPDTQSLAPEVLENLPAGQIKHAESDAAPA